MAATVELDLLGLDNRREPKKPRSVDRQTSIRGIQTAISRINPHLLRHVIASSSAAGGLHSPAPAAVVGMPPMPVLNPSSRMAIEGGGTTAPQLTIFYNGTVSVFDLPRDKAEGIIKLAEEQKNVGASPVESGAVVDRFLENLNEELPIARKNSLKRFLEKRKERLVAITPYDNLAEEVDGGIKQKPAINMI